MCVLKSLQSSMTLCDPMDHSLPGSSVHGILQTRILEDGKRSLVLRLGLSLTMVLCFWAVNFTSAFKLHPSSPRWDKKARGGWSWVISLPSSWKRLWWMKSFTLLIRPLLWGHFGCISNGDYYSFHISERSHFLVKHDEFLPRLYCENMVGV